MDTPIPIIKPESLDFVLENKIKNFLAHIGWQEIYSYSMVSEKIALESGFELSEHLKISNPLTDDRVYLRRSLIPSLEEILEQNPTKSELSVFEMAKVYHPQINDLPSEDLHLTLVSKKSYREIKGDLASLFRILFIDNLSVEEVEDSTQMQSGIIFILSDKKEKFGSITILPNNHVAVDFEMDQIIKYAKKHPKYQPLPNTSQIVEDLTFTLPEKTPVGNVIKMITKSSNFVYKVKLKDVFQRNHSFAITYWNAKNNLSNEDIEPIRKQIVQQVENEFKAKLVGKV
jgi:phenylalanyl-tRNA synthetase beta chain